MPRFQPRYVSITLAAACTTLASHATLALSCALSGGGEELKEPLDKVIVVDRSPAGSEIWRSPVKHAAVRCDFDQARAGWSERIYFYPNPRNATPVPNVEFGVLYKNVAYWSNARIDTGYKTMPDSRAPNGFGVSFNLDFQVIMRKKSAGAIGQATMSSFDVWQMDGEGGLNDRRYALNYQVTGLSNVTRTSCAATVKASPGTLYFETLSKRDMERGKTAVAPFSLDFAGSACNTPLSVDVVFSSPLSDATHTYIVPPDNRSVGIAIRKPGQNFLAIDAPVPMLSNWTGGATSQRLEAVLDNVLNTVALGAFSATATIMLQFR
ncbi:hypothetical protein JCM19000A_37170 [Silvimonas sp. JCM 19000]